MEVEGHPGATVGAGMVQVGTESIAKMEVAYWYSMHHEMGRLRFLFFSWRWNLTSLFLQVITQVP